MHEPAVRGESGDRRPGRRRDGSVVLSAGPAYDSCTEVDGGRGMGGRPPVRRTINFDGDDWEQIEALARESGVSPEQFVAWVAARVGRSADGDLVLRA